MMSVIIEEFIFNGNNSETQGEEKYSITPSIVDTMCKGIYFSEDT